MLLLHLEPEEQVTGPSIPPLARFERVFVFAISCWILFLVLITIYQAQHYDMIAASGKRSAGLLMYRRRDGAVEVLLVHPGGPFWAKKDEGAWSLPKGAIDPGEDELLAAIREFEEETGFTAEGEFIALTRLKQPSGKVISAWAVEGDCDPAAMTSTTFSMEWPPRSGTMAEFPETDRIEWFDIETAKSKIIRGQRGFIEEFEEFITRS